MDTIKKVIRTTHRGEKIFTNQTSDRALNNIQNI